MDHPQYYLDQNGSGATFANNIAYRNNGSCIRSTNSPNPQIVDDVYFGKGGMCSIICRYLGSPPFTVGREKHGIVMNRYAEHSGLANPPQAAWFGTRRFKSVLVASLLCACTGGNGAVDSGAVDAAATANVAEAAFVWDATVVSPADRATPDDAARGPVADSGGDSAEASASDALTIFDASPAGDGAIQLIDAGDATAPSGDAGDDAANDAEAPVTIAQPHEMHCVNWADTRDNFVNGVLQLSGLNSRADTYDAVQSKTSQIASQFHDKLGANTIRIPINEPTAASAWWNAYKAVIDTTTGMGMNVIVAYWAYHNGRPDDESAFRAMWETVVTAYAENNRVFFDIHNEPSGYARTWNDAAARWLDYFPSLPRGRVIVAGIGVDETVVPVGSDSRFDGCILELHYYGFWYKDWTTQKQWLNGVSGAVGAYASRTLVGEWGAAMSTGLDYNTSTPDGNNEISYITAMADFMRENNMGSCYWPGLRDDDTYAMMKREANGSTITLSVVNASGFDRLHWAWNL